MLCVIDSQSKNDPATAMDLYVVERLYLIAVAIQNESGG